MGGGSKGVYQFVMKILHLIYDHVDNPWVGGGGAVRAFEIYRRLAKKGHEITVVSGAFPNCRDGNVEGIEFKFLGTPRNYYLSVFSYALSAASFLKENFSDYDVIVEDFAPWNPVCSYRFQDRKAVFLQLHHKEGMEILKRYLILGLPFYILEKTYPRKFHRVISVSEATARKFKLRNAYIIPNGINLPKSSQVFKGDYILYLGRIDFHNKGLDLLLEAVRNLDVKLYIAGRGKDSKLLQKKIHGDTLLSKRVKYLGFVSEEEKSRLIENCRFLVLPSRYEGQGIVVLEAAARGKPVLVSNIEELDYVVKNGFGVSFEKTNPADLREKIKFLWEREDLLKELSRKASEYAKNFTWDRIADKYEKLLLSHLQT